MPIHKCRKCIWSDKISSNVLYCTFPICIMKEKTSKPIVSEKDKIIVSKARRICNHKRKRR
ncbi:hypothetical protein [Clostridium sporogenes]|uniref:hypothetical protein n=1 Tax=Clostridium sporogenes TaxID=1509 RepID=UPI0006ACF264|nr:hypothetical protein [Clostridium sporogenes]MDU4596920.1 hypothetical protein [Clostridium sporogenes]NFQ33530.1 hypothetical protein [Clostridium sporogenes]NFQ59055.1 hypothetical protein [Clostridium sporogenes]NFU09103.1 hypothetical protein [Clostridium sporogenes]NFU42222.1 hypothetical protein [Clostridium sporogenes]